MARKSTPAPENKEVALDTTAIAGDFQAATQLAAITQGYSEDRDLLNQLLGQAQMADAFSKFSKTVLTSKMAFVKEQKLYQQLKGKRTRDGLESQGTWAEFCNMLGMTPEHANESIANLNQFGTEALESMSSMGIGYREMRQYRKLPEDQKLALIEAAKAGDKADFLDLAEEIITRHAKEKEDLTRQLEESKAEKLATEELLGNRKERIDALERSLQRIKTMPVDKAVAELRAEATKKFTGAQGLVTGELRSALQSLHEFPQAEGKGTFMAGLVGQLMADLIQLRDEFGLPDLATKGTPEWQQWADQQDAAPAGAAQ